MKAKSHATQRTKNRIREHQLERAEDRAPAVIDGRLHLFFRCIGHCQWIGWLPEQELEEL